MLENKRKNNKSHFPDEIKGVYSTGGFTSGVEKRTSD